jgi:nicotinamidase/pyrazinamidase
MNAQLLIIDPQNDFCDIPGAALPVSGADADMKRLAKFLAAARNKVADVVVTLDSHPTVAIERTTFWKTADGQDVAPFTQITEADVRGGRYLPRNEALIPSVLTYLNQLEAGGKYTLMVWPVHCVLGTPGHAIHAAVSSELAAWETTHQQGVFKVLKGLNPLTEQYSAVRAEVPRYDDESTQTNTSLVSRVAQSSGYTLVAGEASSHCVASTMAHLYEVLTPEQLSRVILLHDCMSPVSGFESAQDAFFEKSKAMGVRVISSDEALALLN